MTTLREYVETTIERAAIEYGPYNEEYTEDSLKSACEDALRGTNTGWWSDLIYTADILEMANKYRIEVRQIIREYNETYALYGMATHVGQFDQGSPITIADLVCSTCQDWTWEDYIGSNGVANEFDATAATYAIRWAVENLAWEFASHKFPDCF